MKIEDVLDKHQDQLMAVPEVTGIGIGERAGSPVLVVMVNALTAELKARIPSRLEGFAVEIEVIGEISAF
jgi:hypothetical protein